MPIRPLHSLAVPAWIALLAAAASAPQVWACDPAQDVCLELLEDKAPPAPALSPAAPAAADVDAVSLLADQITADLKARRLTRPPGDNALERIEKMKVLAPEHDYALNGRQYVVNIYLALARWQWRRDNREAAMKHLATARSLDPGSAAVEETAAQLLAGDNTSQARAQASKPAATPDKPKPESEPAPETNTQQTATAVSPTDIAQQEVPVEPTEVWRQRADARYPEMVAIPAGSFEMGGSLPAELPRHEVQLSAFSVSRQEVTVAQYRHYALDAGVKMPEIASDRDLLPVTGVNWHDARGYAAWLAARTGRPYRLPTEAEWEYAARAGTVTPYFGGETLRDANCVGCDTVDHAEPLPVGSYAANDFGLYDTHGNVWEWVVDCWRDNYRNADGTGEAYDRDDCQRRVLRGGSWYNTAEFARSAYRGREVSGFRDGGVGFRVAHDGL